jgi:Fe2+ or Zn2+ uptake regulation protein
VRRAEELYIDQITSTTVYKSGVCFPAHEIQRCLSRRSRKVGVSRIREVLNAMVDRGMLTSKLMPGGETHYQPTIAKVVELNRLWPARPVSHEHTPVWR